jgi:hypothetical protein
VSDGRERFLRAIAERVPSASIEEIRLFAPLRQGGVESGVAVITVAGQLADEARPRHTIFRAQYRLTLKGPERGRWEVSVTEEADAPQGTVDDVVRGVLRRSGEETEPEPERLVGDELHGALLDNTWTGAR